MLPMTRLDPTASEPKVLRLHIEGVEELGGDVRLGAFIEKLSALKASLAEADHLARPDEERAVDFVVSELSHSSPAMVGLSPVSAWDHGRSGETVVDWLTTFLKRVKDGDVTATSDHSRLVGHLRKLVAGVGERFERLWIDGTGLTPIQLDADVAKALDDALPNIRKELGTIKGVVKRYSGVGAQPYFKIIPPVGGIEIKCTFPQSMLAEAAKAVERTATIEGELKHYEDDLWPYEVRVHSITLHDNDQDLPTLGSMAGTAPNATGDLSAEDFVRVLRDEW